MVEGDVLWVLENSKTFAPSWFGRWLIMQILLLSVAWRVIKESLAYSVRKVG
jgi:hypothetical protein